MENSSSRRVTMILVTVGVVIAIVAIILALSGSGILSGTLVASEPTQNPDAIRTQVIQDVTNTAVMIAQTDLAATVNALAFQQPQVVIVTATPPLVQATSQPQILIVTVTPPPPAQVVSRPQECQQLGAENNLPDGFTYTLVVEPDTFHIWKAGQNVCVAHDGQSLGCFNNSPTLGIEVAFLPVNNETTTYELSGLLSHLNFHAIYAGCSDEERSAVILDTSSEILSGPCGSGQSCAEARVAVFVGSSVVSDEVRTR